MDPSVGAGSAMGGRVEVLGGIAPCGVRPGHGCRMSIAGNWRREMKRGTVEVIGPDTAVVGLGSGSRR
jgi:hypothetical protein